MLMVQLFSTWTNSWPKHTKHAHAHTLGWMKRICELYDIRMSCIKSLPLGDFVVNMPVKIRFSKHILFAVCTEPAIGEHEYDDIQLFWAAIYPSWFGHKSMIENIKDFTSKMCVFLYFYCDSKRCAGEQSIWIEPSRFKTVVANGKSIIWFMIGNTVKRWCSKCAAVC